MNKILEILRKRRSYYKDTAVIEVEEEEFITDEIEKSLMEMKEAYDLPTEEVRLSIESRRNLRKKEQSS